MGRKQDQGSVPAERAQASGAGTDRGEESRGRFSAPRKAQAVLRLLRGEDLETLSRELGVTAATLSQWQETFLAAGQASLKSRPADERDEQVHELHAKLGEVLMENELLWVRCRAQDAGRPLAARRRKR
jgi:hypothetical protein